MKLPNRNAGADQEIIGWYLSGTSSAKLKGFTFIGPILTAICYADKNQFSPGFTPDDSLR